MRIAHIVNPVILDGSDLTIAQPVTFESMRVAAAFAAPTVEVDLVSTQYPEDRPIVPADFTMARDLDRSALDLGTFVRPRKLPLVQDIIERVAEASPEADAYIYTNVDIGLVPNFYASVAALMESHDALVINRRTMPSEPNRPEDLPLIWANVGMPHPGYDCFVFSSDLLAQINLERILIGVPWIGTAFLGELAAYADRLELLTDAHLTFHIGDDRVWRNPALDDYREHNRREVARMVSRWAALGRIKGRPFVERVVLQGNFPESGSRSVRARRRLVRRLRRLPGAIKRRTIGRLR